MFASYWDWNDSGDQDVRDATIDKAHYLAQIGDKDESIKIFGTGKFSIQTTRWVLYLELILSFRSKQSLICFFIVFQEDKKVPLGVKLDVTFSLLRIGLFYNDRTLIVENVKKARKMIDDGGDWDRRNRLKVYEGLYKLTIRDFKWVRIYDTRSRKWSKRTPFGYVKIAIFKRDKINGPFWGFHHVNRFCHSLFGSFSGPCRKKPNPSGLECR